MKKFYANVIFDGDELRCWVRGKDFTVTPSYLAFISNINWPVCQTTSVWWFGTGSWHASRCSWRKLGDIFKWEINRCVITISRIKAAHNNYVSQSLSSLKHWVRESWSGFFSSWHDHWWINWHMFTYLPHFEQDCWEDGLKELPSFLLPHFRRYWSSKEYTLEDEYPHPMQSPIW